MIVLDTCILIYDALNPKKLTTAAIKAITDAENKNQLCCSDISLWEVAMLVEKKRLDPGTDAQTFLHLILQSRNIQVLSITVEIAALSTSYPGYHHFDPADRIIAATAIHHHAELVTSDKKLSKVVGLSTLW